MSGFGIFLVPATSQYKKYNKIITSLSKKYDTLNFEAHVTVLGKLEAEEKDLVTKVKKIANGLNKIETNIFGVNFTNTFYQCVFAQLKMSPQLLNLYQELGTDLKYVNKSPYFPHMSLIYGDLSTEEKANIAGQVKVGKKILLDKLVIVRNGPLPSDWTHVAEFTLN